MFCVYNISLDNCNHITVSSSIGHTLYNDYLSVYLGNKSRRLYGDEVGTFADDTSLLSGKEQTISTCHRFNTGSKTIQILILFD